MVEGENELREIEMPRKMLPYIELITTIMQVPENTQNACTPFGHICGPHLPKCCPETRCTQLGPDHKCA
jgi:hypothetical protein